MDYHVKEYYRQSSDETPHGNFHAVIALHENPNLSWKSLKDKVPDLSRGWFELAHLSAKDRIEFTRDFWLSKLPYSPNLNDFLYRFFSTLDDIGVFITQKKFEDPYDTHLVYSIKNNSGFFRGAPPISEKHLLILQKSFSDFMLPSDYLAFMQIHDGFRKATDCTGITRSTDMLEVYKRLQYLIQQHEPIMTSRGATVDPKTLIPFYESFGMPFYQCFWAEWYPKEEMGNVYYSGETNTIADAYSGGASSEVLAFPTFVDWLIFYLESIE